MGNPSSQIDLAKKRVRPNPEFVQDKDDCNFEKRSRVEDEHSLVDRISNLPDEIIVNILSLLPLKVAGATSVLSRRWRYLWASTMTLNFQANNFGGCSNFSEFSKLELELRDRLSFGYVDWVNHVLEQHRGPSIRLLRAHFFLDYRFQSSIDKWIQFAMEKRVQILELEFPGREDAGYDYTFPHGVLGISIQKKGTAVEQFLNSAWKNLNLGWPNLQSCGYSSIGFKSLKVLRLRHVVLTEEVVEHLLSNCPLLETLLLIAARGLVNLRVVGPSIAIKHLRIHHCDGLKSIEIRDANIVTFICNLKDRLFNDDVSINNVPLLVEVSITHYRYSNDSVRLLFNQICFSQLRILALDIYGPDYFQNVEFPMLGNLKHLTLLVTDLGWDPLHLIFFLKAAPYMQRLVFKLWPRRGTEACRKVESVEKAPKFPHHDLKVVEVQGYRAHTCVSEDVIYLIENAVALEKIVIDPVKSWYWPTGMLKPIEIVDEEVKGLDHAMQLLKDKVPSTIEFVCL